MKTVSKYIKKLPQFSGLMLLIFCSCSTVKEQGDPNVAPDPAVITNDVQRRAIYERGSNVALPQNANPIPNSEQLKLNEKASETNRKRNIEEGDNINDPGNKPTEERPRQLPNIGNDTIYR